MNAEVVFQMGQSTYDKKADHTYNPKVITHNTMTKKGKRQTHTCNNWRVEATKDLLFGAF